MKKAPIREFGAFCFAVANDPASGKFPDFDVNPPLPQIHHLVLLLTDFLSLQGETRG
jgi:hypothetical protein